jgi:hypothetical protein
MWAVRPVIAPHGMPPLVKLPPIAGHLQNGLQTVAHHLVVGVKRQDTPDRPALAIIIQSFGGDRNRLGTIGCTRGHREHENFGALPEKRIRIALADAVDIRLMPVVAANRHALPKISRRANLAEEMIAPKLAIGVSRQAAQKQVALDVTGGPGLVQKRVGQSPRSPGDRRTDHPHEHLDHGQPSPRLDSPGQPEMGVATSLASAEGTSV